MKTIIILLAGVVCWSACQQPAKTEDAPAADSMELNNRGYIPVDTGNTQRTDTSAYDNNSNKTPAKDSLPR